MDQLVDQLIHQLMHPNYMSTTDVLFMFMFWLVQCCCWCSRASFHNNLVMHDPGHAHPSSIIINEMHDVSQINAVSAVDFAAIVVMVVAVVIAVIAVMVIVVDDRHCGHYHYH